MLTARAAEIALHSYVLKPEGWQIWHRTYRYLGLSEDANEGWAGI